MEAVLVRDIMTPAPVAVPPSASVYEAARLMRGRNIGSLLVMEGARPVGIVTERDFVTKVLAEGANPRELRVGDVMSSPLLTVPPTLGVEEAARLMARKGVRRLPVSDRGRLVGLVTERDIVAALPSLAEVTHRSGGALDGGGAALTACDSCLGLTDGSRRVDGQVVCENCYLELRAR